MWARIKSFFSKAEAEVKDIPITKKSFLSWTSALSWKMRLI